MKYLFIMNPGSRGGASLKRFQKIFDMLDEQKVRYDYKITTSLDDAYNFSVTANKEGFDVITAVGGDGTINQVLNGFYDSEGKRISRSKFGVIYTGTSPDFCKSYNIPIDTKGAVKVLLQNKTNEIQIGKITFVKNFDRELDGKTVDAITDQQICYFGCCANIGLGATLARTANSGIRKKLGDFAGTFLALIKTLFKYKPNDFIIRCDNGSEQKLEKVYSISIGKTFYIASGIKVENDLKNGDGRFYNLIVKNIKRQDWLDIFKKIYRGKQFVNNNVISLDYSKAIEVYGNSKNSEIEFDGDPAGYLPCKIEMAEDSLDIICEAKYE